MLINDLIDLLLGVPPMLAGAWAVWLGVGLALSIWQRRDKVRLVMQGAAPRHQSGWPPSGNRFVRTGRQPAPVSSGDAFSELEALLEAPVGSHRTPGDAPSSPAPQSLP